MRVVGVHARVQASSWLEMRVGETSGVGKAERHRRRPYVRGQNREQVEPSVHLEPETSRRFPRGAGGYSDTNAQKLTRADGGQRHRDDEAATPRFFSCRPSAPVSLCYRGDAGFTTARHRSR